MTCCFVGVVRGRRPNRSYNFFGAILASVDGRFITSFVGRGCRLRRAVRGFIVSGCNSFSILRGDGKIC